jgi:outer membrane protein assembly factor BamD
MINMFPDSTLVPRAKQKLRDVQEVLAERETGIGLFYESRENFGAAIARLETVTDTYPLYSKSDQALLGIGDAYAGEARRVQITPNLPGAIKERLRSTYLDKAAQAYSKVITRYPMAPHVEDARDRLVAMNHPVPEPTQEAVAENDAEERSRQAVRFTDKTFDIIRHGPMVVEAVHVGEPSLDDPKRTLAPDITKQNVAMYNDAVSAGRPPAASNSPITPTSVNEPPRSDQPSAAPLQLVPPAGGTGVGAEIVSAPAGAAATSQAPVQGAPADATAGLKAIGPVSTAIPAAEKPADAPVQVNDIKSTGPTVTAADDKSKKPKVDSNEESSSKKKKKKGLAKLNPF